MSKNTTMKCKSAEQLLLDYIEGTLSSGQMDRLELHLASCSHCQQELQAFEKTIHLASSLPIKYPSPEAWENFWPRLQAKIEQNPPVEKDRILLWLRAYRWKIASVVCFLVILLSLWGIWSYDLFKVPIADSSPSLDERIIQGFMSEISAKQLQELLNYELQRLEETSLTWSHESFSIDEIRLRKSAPSNDLINQLFKVIATEVNLKDFEDEELTDLVSSMESKFILTSLY